MRKKPQEKIPSSRKYAPKQKWQPGISHQAKCPPTPTPTKKPFGCIKKSLKKKMIEGKAAINTEKLGESWHLCCVVQGLQIS